MKLSSAWYLCGRENGQIRKVKKKINKKQNQTKPKQKQKKKIEHHMD